MTLVTIEAVRAVEILDSRGRPTLAVHVDLTGDAGSGHQVSGTATVPSGASTGLGEAHERRDGDPDRYGGAGVLGVVGAVRGEIADLLTSRSWSGLPEIDRALIRLDGTTGKSRLGANALLGASVAAARALAAARGLPLWQWLDAGSGRARMPVPYFNVINGGAHAPNPLEFQEFMIAPVGAPDLTEAVRAGAEIYVALRRRLAALGHHTGLGDEGGFAPDLERPEEALTLLVESIRDAGYRTGPEGVCIAMDPAASQFRTAEGSYRIAGETLSTSDLVDHYASLVGAYPIHSIEDGVAEDDAAGWQLITERLGHSVQLVGDDNLVTDPHRIRAAAANGMGNAALIKPNQIGTLTECLEALSAARAVGFAAMVSHRSGDTCDDMIADLAVGSGCGQIKSGAPARGERVAKYNRLLEIDAANSLPWGPDQ